METKSSKLAAVALIYGEEGKILGVSRKEDTTKFGLPGGKIDWGEKIYDGMVREVKEETGIDISDTDFTYAVKVNNNSIYYYLETKAIPVCIQESKYQDENDVNGIGWIKLQCLYQSLSTGHIKMNSHGKYVLEHLKKNKFNIS